ncbi:2TM domain-containing protein [Flavivirga jejuensis]|uniref:2TM domain-containing protein n=1 Tax=Flavivirga jejuensis TaxID=870487 RepID=A0ABT8WTS3_9FLAO|nr:2TM domain-containing protein [Flavivirga jejuensis]MDO5976583.1 2TM domain-containing protein [Flavivirga jejuensis]
MKKLSDTEVDSTYLRATKRVKDLKEFYYSLIAYCLVIPFLVFINYKTFWEFQWFWFPMAGWGIGLGFQAYHTFVNNGILGRQWEERKMQEFIDAEEKKHWK